MKAVILAAGKGTRLRPLTYTKPKALIPLANKPIIQYIVEELVEVGVEEIFIVTNYLEGKVKDFFAAQSFDANIVFVHQEELGGTGDALRTVSNRIKEDFIMVNGDEVFETGTFSKLLHKFRQETALAVVAGAETEHPERYGVLVTDAQGALTDIKEKPASPPSKLVNAGAYVFSPKIFDYLAELKQSKRGEYELTDAIVRIAVETCRVFVSEIHGWQSVSMLWDLFEANRMKIEERAKKEKSEKSVIIGKDVDIKPGVYIEGKVVIGDGSVIGPNCYIRGNTSIGRNCRIGNGVEIKNSIIMDSSNVPHLSYIGDSVIGEHCNLGAGTISGNLRHDHKNVKVLVKGEVVESDRHKIGFFAADWTKTGVGTMVYPGRLLGPFSWTAPNETVDCNVEPFTMLSSSGKKRLTREKLADVVRDKGEKMFLESLYDELKDVKY